MTRRTEFPSPQVGIHKFGWERGEHCLRSDAVIIYTQVQREQACVHFDTDQVKGML